MRTRHAHMGLDLALVIQSRRALFDMLRWLISNLHNAPRVHPILPCLDLLDFPERIDSLARERAEFWCLLQDDQVLQ